MQVDRFLSKLRSARSYAGQVVHVEQLPARAAQTRDLKPPLPRPLARGLEQQGIGALYSHQVHAIELLRRGESAVVVTRTASGKTLCYNLPALERLLIEPRARFLYLFPTKALAQDQLRGLERWAELVPQLKLRTGTYDGDTPMRQRKRIRDEAQIALTNPDMLHAAILPHHGKWADFLSRLELVVVDEIHLYRGAFGANVANVLRRLKRLCAHHGSRPRFLCCSATIANPVELAQRLTGEAVALIDEDGSPRGRKVFALWNPALVSEATMERRSANTEASDLMCELMRERYPGIAFVRTRRATELLVRYVREQLGTSSPLRSKLRAYRGGYLPEERREIEHRLFSGELLGVVSTNALEIGIDVGALDAAILVGYPGSIASLWQQAGRAGRRGEDSVAVLIAHNLPLDQYLMQHPRYLFERPTENAVLDPDNPHVVLGHLRAAAYELPLRPAELSGFGDFAAALVELLLGCGHLRELQGRFYWAQPGYPAQDFSLRDASDSVYTIVEAADPNRVIGTVDESSAFSQVHGEAIYLHEAETYFVRQLDLKQKIAYVERVDTDYYTQAVTETDVRVVEEETRQRWRRSELAFGQLDVTELVTLFRKIKFGSRDSIGFGNLDLPPQVLHTVGLWLMPPAAALAEVAQAGRSPAEGLLGISNVLEEIVPLFVMCDRSDIGASVHAKSTAAVALFLYDKYPGGLGFAHKVYELFDEILRSCLLLIRGCECEDGCPSCVGAALSSGRPFDEADRSPRIPDKEAALVLLHYLLELEPYRPRRGTGRRPRPALQPTGPSEAEVGSLDPPLQVTRRLPEEIERRLRERLRSGRLPSREQPSV
jgi:DEAD/DEAH box helicase domain-containing protein